MEQFLERQRAFTERFLLDRGVKLEDLRKDPEALVRWLKDYAFHLEGEVHEFIGEFSWKMHVPPAAANALVRSNAREEWVDMLKYLLGMAVLMGYDAPEIWREFDRKSAVVELKYEQERALNAIPEDARVVAVDLDGVLAEYPRGWLQWLRTSDATLSSVLSDARTSADARRLLGARRYEECKHVYRDSGGKARLPLRPGARQLLAALRGAGCKVVILSARPYKRYSRIFADTMTWLESFGLHYDGIFFDERKHLKILERFPRLTAMVEDTPEQAVAVAEQGYPVYLPRNEDNEGWHPAPGRVVPCADLHEVRDMLLSHLETLS